MKKAIKKRYMKTLEEKFPDRNSIQNYKDFHEYPYHVIYIMEKIVATLSKNYAPNYFIHYLIMNDLIGTLAYANDIDMKHINKYIVFLYDEIPSVLIYDYQKNNINFET